MPGPSPSPKSSGPPPPPPPPPRSQLRRLLDRPDARPRVARAVVALVGTGGVAIGAIGGLLLWHIARRGRLIREGLPPPKPSRPADPDWDGPGPALPSTEAPAR